MISLPDVDTLMAGGLQARLDGLAAERAKAKEKVYWTGGGGVAVGILVGLILHLRRTAICLFCRSDYYRRCAGLGQQYPAENGQLAESRDERRARQGFAD